jgi:tetratricopeptide (TPR) repeat protein
MTRRFLAICILALVAFSSSVRAEDDPRDAERQFRFLLSRGEELQTQGGAVSPTGVERWKAQMHRLDGDYKHFLNDHPLHTRAMVAYGSLLYDQHLEDEGVRWWEKAITIDPNEAYAYNNLANDYGHNGHADKALRYYQKAIDLVPTEPIFRFNWATTCQMYRNESKAVYGWSKEEIFQHALDQFRQARDLVPQDFEMASTYAQTFYMMPKPDWQGAYDGWQFCLKQPLDDGQRQLVYANIARVCVRMGRNDEAKEWVARLTDDRQAPIRRSLEKKIAEQSAATDSAHTNSPALVAPDAVAK